MFGDEGTQIENQRTGELETVTKVFTCPIRLHTLYELESGETISRVTLYRYYKAKDANA